MEARLIVAVVFICAVCRFTEAQMQNTTALTSNITRTGCGSTKMCVSSPTQCDPAGNSGCYFMSTQLTNTVLTVELAGTTSGYVALGLTLTSSQLVGFSGTAVFVCGKNNNSVFFETATQNGPVLTPANLTILNITSVQGSVLGNVSVQCVFNVTSTTIISILTSPPQLNSTISIFNGTTNGTDLGNATTLITTGPFDLANPKSNIPPVNTPPLNISRNGCDISKMCLSTPSACEPAGSDCFFMSSKVNNQIIFFELSGRTSGYVALGLTKQNSTYVFVCGNNYNSSSNSSSFFFQTATQNGTVLTPANMSTVYYYQGQVTQNQNLIQCIFNTSTTFNITTKAGDTVYNITILNGTTNGIQLGNATTLFATRVSLDLSNPSAPLSLTTQSPQTNPANGCNSVISLWTHVLAVLLSAMSLHFITSHSS